MIGHIKIDRKILNWEWYQDLKAFHYFLYLLLKANHKDGKWQGVEIKRGQVITGRQKASAETGLTEREIRSVQKNLKMTGEITVKSTNKYSIITICKYDVYQSNNYKNDQQNVSQVTSKTSDQAHPNDQQTTTNNNNKNNKEDKNNTATPVIEMKEVGIEQVKIIANDVWKDKGWMESLCIGNGLKMADAKDWMVQFNLSVSQDAIVDFDPKRYKKMFQGWLRMKLGNGQKVTKVSDKNAEVVKHMKEIGL